MGDRKDTATSRPGGGTSRGRRTAKEDGRALQAGDRPAGRAAKPRPEPAGEKAGGAGTAWGKGAPHPGRARGRRNLSRYDEDSREFLERLEASRDLHTELYESAPLGLLDLDEKGVILRINRAGAAILGVTQKSLKNRPFADFVAPYDVKAFHAHLHGFREEEAPRATELILHVRGRPHRTVLLESAPVRSPGGAGTAWRAAIVDITDRKRREAALRRRAARLEALARLGGLALTEISLQDFLREVTSQVSKALLTPSLVLITKPLPDGSGLSILSDVGFPRRNPRLIFEAGEHPAAEEALAIGKTFLFRDLRLGRSLRIPGALETQRVASGAIAPIGGRKTPFGTLEVYARTLDAFDEDDRTFLQTAAAIIGTAIDRRLSEEELAAAKIFRETIEDSLVTGLVAVDHVGRILSVNDAFCAMTGWSREELLGMEPPYRFWPLEEIKTIRATAWKTLGKGSPLADQEFVLLRRSGERFPVLVYASPFRDPEGTPKGYVVSVSDITERKKAETEYRTILKTAMDGFWISDHEGRFLDVNDAACRHFGYTREELLGGMRIPGIEAAESPEETAARIRKIREEGQDRFETRHRRKDGRIVHAEVSVNYLDIGGGRFFVFIRDISERKKAEAALKESEERFRSLVENSLVGFFLVQEGKVVFQNPEQEKLFGTIPESLALADFANVHPEDRAQYAALGDAADAGTAAFSIRFLSPGGGGVERRARWASCRTTPVSWHGRDAVLVNMVDVTQLKEMERIALVQEKMASLGHVATGIAHEIRNPLSGINLYLSALEKVLEESEGLDPEAREMAGTITGTMKGASAKIEAVIRRVMDFSKPAPMRKGTADVNRAVQEVVHLYRVKLSHQGVALELTLAEMLPPCDVDLQLLEQVLLNILTNATQALETVDGRKAIAIASFREDNRVVVAIGDSGPGVPEEIRHRIFDPFFTTKKEGTGIGLSFSHKVIADHGGIITVGSSRLGGAEFRICLPVPPKPS
jgi:PAS domain S-box-containing protein